MCASNVAGDLEILIDGHLALILVEVLRLQLLGGVAIGSGFALRAVYDDGGGETASDIADAICGTFGGFGELEGHARLIEEALGGHGFGGVFGEPRGEQVEELLVA